MSAPDDIASGDKAPEPLETGPAEYLDRPPAPSVRLLGSGASGEGGYGEPEVINPGSPRAGAIRVRGVVLERREIPCCSGCGCLLLVVASLLLFNGFFGTLVLMIGSVWIASALLRLAGITRVSPAFAFALVPLALIILNSLLRAFSNSYHEYSLAQIAMITVVVWAVMALGRAWGRR